MINRDNKVIEAAVKEGIRLHRSNGDIWALASLKKSNVTNEVINRVVFEPHKIRSTD